MLERNNAHFEGLYRVGCEHAAKCRAHEEKKAGIIETYGWESDEIKAWYDEKAAMKSPITMGQHKAYRAYTESLEKETEEIEMSDFLWDREVKDFVDTLRKAGFKTFVYTNTSTAVMENLHEFAAEGCRLAGLCTITRHETRWGTNEEAFEVQGIRFEVC